MKRINWPLGRIEEIIPGKDKVCRVARVKTEMGELLRAFQPCYSVEVNSAHENFILKTSWELVVQ